MDPTKLAAIVINLVIAIVVALFIAWLFRGAAELIQAPAKLDAAVGANHALEAGVEHQNAAVDQLAKDGKKRKAASAAAVQAAGNDELAKGAAIAATPAAGSTPLERAATRINQEFGR